CLPSTHRSPYYGYVHTGRIPTTAAMARWAAAYALPTATFYPATAAGFAEPAAAMNPDGIHWGFGTHQLVAEEVAGVLGAALDTRQH
ncbi:MAG: SGNH/GDSL hydrolase family protein, partial [Gordonia sp. (in: high G+C Gram-positive bacteria)]